MKADRLLRLADKLQGEGAYVEVGPINLEKFDLESWIGKLGGERERKVVTSAILNECGTTACAIGHAMLDPWFRRRGLVPKFDPSKEMIIPTLRGTDPTRYESLFEPVAQFFEISQENAKRLFDPYYYNRFSVTPNEVAQKIRRYVKNATV